MYQICIKYVSNIVKITTKFEKNNQKLDYQLALKDIWVNLV